ncbi:MAG TPA: DUF1016 N-terminal domain-containing protein, partial [Pyrinomonadaceae bacterium]|nr:DUF1016 N-terminal domain-containing protein [Pyrinomonadaceae bacterium]
MKIEQLSENSDFEQIVRLIEASRNRALQKVNAELVMLNYQIGQIVSQKVANGIWGEKTVDELADFINGKMPELKGFTRRGLYRMKQFYETYSPDSECFQVWSNTQPNTPSEIVSTALTQLPDSAKQANKMLFAVLVKISWSNHLKILSATKSAEEKIFYLMLTERENLTFRELERQINTGIYERTMLGKQKLSALLREIHPTAETVFKDKYIFEFLDLPEPHSETDLEKALVENFKDF